MLGTSDPQNDQTLFPLTRTAALARLAAFLPGAGMAYAQKRNLDLGPAGHVHVSRLSAALRRRVVGENEVVAAVLSMHGPSAAEKFVSEVFWRTYWKGWLEQRPTVWAAYLDAVVKAQTRIAADPGLTDRLDEASAGRTGIDCFDAWVAELDATGYLHNWARMQFASIWIFTLGLPWEMGARFMLERLIDGDPASNTLSWRWVAGLHTAGKAYLADADRIRAMTDGRFAPTGLARRADIPQDSIAVPPPSPWRRSETPDPLLASALLVTAEDLSLETQPALAALPVRAIVVLPGETVADRMALTDATDRASRHWPDAVLVGPACQEGLASAKMLGCRQVVTGFAPVGPTAARLETLRRTALEGGLPMTEYPRDWDRRAWPHCRKGFFALKEKIPALVKAAGIIHDA